MVSQRYTDEILWAYTGEIYGRAMFYTLSDKTDDPEIARKCRVLGDLEAATSAAMDGLIEKYDLEYDEGVFAANGHAKGAEYAKQDWQALMRDFDAVIDDDDRKYLNCYQL